MSLVYIHLGKKDAQSKNFWLIILPLLVFFLDHSVGQTLKWNSFELEIVQIDTV